MIAIPIVLTEHAILRFQERIVPGLDFFAATDLLAELLDRAYLYHRDPLGALHWKLPIYGAIVVSRPDEIRGEELHVARTVLASGPRIAPDLDVSIPSRERVCLHEQTTREDRCAERDHRQRRSYRFDAARHIRRLVRQGRAV
jgi:hypothetical protein